MCAEDYRIGEGERARAGSILGKPCVTQKNERGANREYYCMAMVTLKRMIILKAKFHFGRLPTSANSSSGNLIAGLADQ